MSLSFRHPTFSNLTDHEYAKDVEEQQQDVKVLQVSKMEQARALAILPVVKSKDVRLRCMQNFLLQTAAWCWFRYEASLEIVFLHLEPFLQQDLAVCTLVAVRGRTAKA